MSNEVMTIQQFKEFMSGSLKPLYDRLEAMEAENNKLTEELGKAQTTFSSAFKRPEDRSEDPVMVGPYADPRKGKGLDAARFVRYLTLGQSAYGGLQVAKQHKDDRMVAAFEKAMSVSDFTAGGATVPDEFVKELIGLLESATVFRSAGPQQVPMPSGSMTLPRLTDDASASYVGELEAIPKTEVGTGTMQFTARKLAAKIPVSNDLLRQSSPSADIYIRDRLIRAMARREDKAFLYGSGGEHSPKGVRYQCPSSNVNNTQASPDLAKVTQDLIEAIKLLADADVELTRPVWFMRPGVEWALRSVRDGNGNLVFEPQMSAGRLFGIPFYSTTHMRNDRGGSDTEIYLVDMAHVIIADTLSMEVSVFPGGTWEEGANTYSGISRDATVLRAISKHDLQVEHPEAIAVLDECDWDTAL